MDIDQVLCLPKYKGLTITEAYQGTRTINRNLITSYMAYQLDLIYHLRSAAVLAAIDRDDIIFIDTQNLVVKEDYILTAPSMDQYRGDWSKAIEKFFRNRIRPFDRKVGFMDLNNYNSKVFSQKKGKPEIAGGDPTYIKWCIETIPDFFVTPEQLTSLQKLPFYIYLGIKVSFKTSDCFSYSPLIKETVGSFNNEIIALNQDKYDRIKNTDSLKYRYDIEDDAPTFQQYNGTYAQDIGGLSDQEINDIFGGEADAYWNID